MTNSIFPQPDRCRRATPGAARAARGKRAATSLVEVLIVLVVLLIGIFAVIRIFPVGFGQLQQSERRLRGDRLARNFQDQVLGDAANLPEAVTFSVWDTGTGLLSTVTDQDPDDLTDYNGLGNPYFSDVNKFRFIQNEAVKIPLPSQSSSAYGSGLGAVYTLKFGPIYMDPTVGTPSSAPSTLADVNLYNSYLRVTGQPLVAVVADYWPNNNNASRRLRGPNTYLIDYGDDNSEPAIMFPIANNTRIYDVSYTIETTGGGGSAGTGQVGPFTVTIAPGQTGQWMTLASITPAGLYPPNAQAGDTVLPGSDRVTRQFERLAVGANWNPDDPYQYKLISPNVAGTLANFGVIAFNPSGANYSEQTPYGQRAFSALLSYAVLDWHILRDDREVPSPESRVPAGSGDVGVATVRTTLPNIRPTGDEDADGNPYRGLYDTDPTTGPDIQVFNLENPNGVPLNGGDYTEPLDASFDYWVRRDRGGSYQSGIIYINTDRVRAGTPLRILYKAQGDWAVALQKAVSDYRYSGGVRPAVNQAASFGADGNRLYFHRTELNKAAVVTIEYVQGGEVVRLPSRQFTIDNADGAYAWVDVTRIAPQITAAGVTGWNVHGNIHGVSVKTRVIWKDNQTFRNPWRVQDLESIIPQAPPTL